MTLHIDFETRSTVDLKETGVYVYAEHPTTDVWCAAYARNDEPVKLWTPGQPVPLEIIGAMHVGETLVAHNAAFERIIWRYILAPRYGWPEPKLEQWRCTMAMALAMSLPGSLGGAAAAVNLPIQKDSAGHRLMLQMSRPRKLEPLTWWDVPEKLDRLYAYCKQDVEVERQLEKRLVPLRESEQRLWWFDQKINDRGVFVDQPLCKAAIKIVDGAKAELDAAMSKATDFAVTACSQRNQLVLWLKSRGVETESIAKDQVDEMLAADTLPGDTIVDGKREPGDVRKALTLRKEGSKASVAKVDALLSGVSADGRAKGLLQYHAAATGRWGGRRFQPQNIRRPELEDIDTLIGLLARGDHSLFSMMYENPMSAISDAIRGMVTASKGRKLVAADFANIEGRVAAWFAGEDWKLKAFSDFDAGSGHDLYKLAYGRAFGVDPAMIGKTDPRRQIGKVMELSLQYQGGHGAFVAMGANYSVDPRDITPVVRAAVSEETWEKALRRFRPQNSFGMAAADWSALRIVIDGWRQAHPRIKQCWKDLEEAACGAVENKGEVFSVGAVRFKVSGSFLWMQLPSKRAICFPNPCIKQKKMPWEDDDGDPVYKESLCYMGVDSFTRQWSEQFAYGGQIFNYVVQGTSRDLLVEAMFRVETADYPVILTVHDEAVAEPKIDHGSKEEFEKLMSELPDWAAGCPVTAAGWEGHRYRKA